jgi:sec-independent protein translocase protein TatA
MFGIGYMELLIIGFIGLLLFGQRLPKVMREMGRGITEFKRGLQDVEDNLRE